jgi:hypothetical protein
VPDRRGSPPPTTLDPSDEEIWPVGRIANKLVLTHVGSNGEYSNKRNRIRQSSKSAT